MARGFVAGEVFAVFFSAWHHDLFARSAEAQHGDALILHYGTAAEPKFLVIDGGPAGVFKGSLKPRLDEIKAAVSPDDSLPLRMVMVSHLDSDHISGILELTNKLVDQQEKDEEPLSSAVTMFRHKSFDDCVTKTKSRPRANRRRRARRRG